MSGGQSDATPAWAEWVDGQRELILRSDRWRAPRDLDLAASSTTGVLHDPGWGAVREVVSFASNDYLGLSRHPAGVAAAHDALERWGTGAGAARLIVGARPVHRALEEELAAWRGCDAAVLFPTGFAANLGVMTTFGSPGVRILSDELNHASIIDGARLARAEVAVYRHGDLDQVADLLDRTMADGLRPLVVTETVFSMDGDVAPLDGLADLCIRHGALLVLDEAHAALGPDTASWCPGGLDVLRIGTLSKALGSLGGFAAGTRAMCELLVNRARSYIFTTASTPADTAAALANLRVLRSPEGDALTSRLRSHVDRLRPGHPSAIIPVVIGGEADAVATAAALLDDGLLVPAIRPPTVPAGTSRLRVTLSAAHTDDQVDRLAARLAATASPARSTGAPNVSVRTRRRDRPTAVLVAGTGTEVGKTWVAAALVRELRSRGRRVAARKPAQSFEIGDDAAGRTDAHLLAAATGEEPVDVCPPHRWYARPMAPPMAAAALGMPGFTIDDLVSELAAGGPPPAAPGPDVVLVETAGGVRSPLAGDGDTVSFARALQPDRMVLVADAGLGTINAVRLAAVALTEAGAGPPVVVLNRFDPADALHRANAAWLSENDGLRCVTSTADLADSVDEVATRPLQWGPGSDGGLEGHGAAAGDPLPRHLVRSGASR